MKLKEEVKILFSQSCKTLLNALTLYCLWNMIISSVFNLQKIKYFEAIALLTVIMVLKAPSYCKYLEYKKNKEKFNIQEKETILYNLFKNIVLLLFILSYSTFIK